MKAEIVQTVQILDLIRQWIKGNNFTEGCINLFSDKTLVVYKNEVPVYLACIYITNSPVAIIGWELANPSVEKQEKKGGLKFLFEKAKELSRQMGYDFLFTTSSTEPVQVKLQESGFHTGDQSVNHYLIKLN